jgi:hypothetical protein
MKKQVGTTSGLLAILAAVYTFFQLSPQAGSSRESTQDKGSRGIAITSSPENEAELEGPWLATRAFFNLWWANSQNHAAMGV